MCNRLISFLSAVGRSDVVKGIFARYRRIPRIRGCSCVRTNGNQCDGFCWTDHLLTLSSQEFR